MALIATPCAFAKDDDDDKVPAAEVEKIEATLSTLGCKGYEGLKKEEQGIYEIDDAKCAMGTVDIKLDKDYTVILDLALLTASTPQRRRASDNQKASRREVRLAFFAREYSFGKMPTTPLPSAAILR